jgi:3',5'-cyclic AMP phosphodiesterase CpdA
MTHATRSLPHLRFAVFTDLHIGATTAQAWHNRFLTDRPEETAAAIVAAVNAEQPEFVVITGDLSDRGSEAELAAARSVLDGLDAPWIVCPGNHDSTAGGDRSAFDRVFGDRAPEGVVADGVLPLPEGVRAVVFSAQWHEQDDGWRVELPEKAVQQVVAVLDGLRPEVLLVFCHFPFVRQSAFIAEQSGGDGRNAGLLWDGERALEALAATAGQTLVFTGHQHFHQIAHGNHWLHVTTASLVEYPAEYRVVTLGQGGVTIQTACGAPDVVDAHPPLVTWVRGRDEDREI